MRRTLYVAAFMLEPGESLLGLRGGVDPDWWITSDDGRIVVPTTRSTSFTRTVPRTSPSAPQRHSFPRTRTSSARSSALRPGGPCPSTYVVCGRDNAIPPALQELMSQRAGTVSHMDASHSPFLSRPGEVTAIIQETLAAVRSHDRGQTPIVHAACPVSGNVLDVTIRV